jgi:O-antigen/teichoic acid export membrane protein
VALAPLVERDRAPRFGTDVLHFGGAVLIALALNVVQVFIVPRRLSVGAFGAYRVFLLYVGYLGALHLGIVDGAFLRWVGRPLWLIRREWPVVLRRLVLLQLPVLLAAALALSFSSTLARTYVIAFALCAVASNLTSFAGYTLQAAGDFRGAGRVTALPAGLLALVVVALPLTTLAEMLAAFIGTYMLAGIVGMMRLATVTAQVGDGEPSPTHAPLSFRELIASGLPVLGAGLATGLSQYADRILVSVAVPVATFAFYGFASSTMAISGVARQTLSRVTLTHAARREGAHRAEFLDGVYDLIAAGFGLALFGEPLFELVVARLIPRYVIALPIVRALIPGALFWVATTVVVLGTLQTYGNVRRQFVVSLIGIALAAGGAAFALGLHAPLWGVAAAASAGTAITWIVGAALTHRVVHDSRPASTVRFLLIVGAQSGALAAALWLAHGWVARTTIYGIAAVLPTLAAARAARDHWTASPAGITR